MAKQSINPSTFGSSMNIPSDIVAAAGAVSDPLTSSARLANIDKTCTTPEVESEVAQDSPDPMQKILDRMASMESKQQAQNEALARENAQLKNMLLQKDQEVKEARSTMPYQRTGLGYKTGEIDPPTDLFEIKEIAGKSFVRLNFWIPVSGAVEVRHSKPFIDQLTGEKRSFTNINIGSCNISASHNTIKLPLNGGTEREFSLKGFAQISICTEMDGTPLAPGAVRRLLTGEDAIIEGESPTEETVTSEPSISTPVVEPTVSAINAESPTE